MLRAMVYRMLYGPYLKSEDGTKDFAERCLSRLISTVTKKSAFYREANENLLVEKANLRVLADELARKKVLDSGEFFSVRRRLWAGSAVTVAVLLAAILLEYTSISALVQTGIAWQSYAAWTVSTVLAVALVGGGLVAVERLLESLLWQRRIEAQAGEASRPEAFVWGLVLLGIELALIGIADVRAGLLTEQAGRSMLYTSFLALALSLPLIGGAIRWDALRYVDAYKRTQAQRHIETRLAQIDSILRQNEAFESNFYKTECLKAWRAFVAFKAVKRAWDAARGVKEDLSGHFAASFRTFQDEANWRYEADVRDYAARSLRKLTHMQKMTAPVDDPAHPYLLPAASNGAGSRTHPAEIEIHPLPVSNG